MNMPQSKADQTSNFVFQVEAVILGVFLLLQFSFIVGYAQLFLLNNKN